MMIFKHSFMLLICVIFVMAFKPTDAINSHAEIYWKTKVGNIPMPNSLKNCMQTGPNDGIVRLNPNYQHSAREYNDISATYAHNVNELMLEHEAIDDCIFFWGNQVNKSQIPQDGREVYFTNDKFREGIKMMLMFKKIDNEPKFLPLNLAKSMPATSDKLQMILNILSVNPKSILGKDIEITMKKCEEKGVKDEQRQCVNSLEAMVDYATANLKSGKNNLIAVSTEQENGKFMEYTVQKVRILGTDDNHSVVCHKMRNPYAVFLCHNIKSTDIYDVSLVGVDGTQTRAVSVCHKDTSTWNPKHYAFEFLKTKPGEPICHFVSADAIIWLPK